MRPCQPRPGCGLCHDTEASLPRGRWGGLSGLSWVGRACVRSQEEGHSWGHSDHLDTGDLITGVTVTTWTLGTWSLECGTVGATQSKGKEDWLSSFPLRLLFPNPQSTKNLRKMLLVSRVLCVSYGRSINQVFWTIFVAVIHFLKL